MKIKVNGEKHFMEANEHPYKVAVVKDDTFFANEHPYKVKIVEGGGLSAKVVDELPEEGESGYIYLVLKEESEEGDIYDEWIWAEKNGEYVWEHIGATNEVTMTLYDSTGQNVDGAMTQKATTDALSDKLDDSITFWGQTAQSGAVDGLLTVGGGVVLKDYIDTINTRLDGLETALGTIINGGGES